MPISINTNTQSLFAQRALGNNTFDLQKSIERLSTGYRINRAGDDAAGLSIAQGLTSEIRGFQKVQQNIGDGISFLQTAEGALGVIQDNLQRIRELAVQGENGTNSDDELDAIQREINERVNVISSLSTDVSFNGNTLLSGAADYTLQTGANDGDTTTLAFASGTAATGVHIAVGATTVGSLGEGAIDLDTFHVGGSGNVTAVGGGTTAVGTIANIDTMVDNVSRMRSYIGAMQNSLESKQEFASIAVENASASRSRIMDVDVASESSNLVRNQILQQTAGAMLAQANSSPQLALSLLP